MGKLVHTSLAVPLQRPPSALSKVIEREKETARERESSRERERARERESEHQEKTCEDITPH